MELISRVIGYFIILNVFIGLVIAECILNKNEDNLQIKNEKGPLIYRYINSTLQFYYPLPELSCFDDVSRIYIACPTSNIFINNATTLELSTTYLSKTNYRSYKIHATQLTFDSDRDFITCRNLFNPTMRYIPFTNVNNLPAYSIGYMISLMDFLETYKIIIEDKNNIMAHVTILSIIQTQPQYRNEYNRIYLKGLVYSKMTLNTTQIYSKEYQMEKFKKSFNCDLMTKYFSDNYLEKGQLISEDDVYYLAQKRSTFFYENIIPIWQTVNQGNWKLVGEIVRKIAIESNTDLKVYVKHTSFFDTWYLGDDDVNKTNIVYVPKVLMKMAYDPNNKSRGIIFYTVNDPHYNGTTVQAAISKQCEHYTECHLLYPEFADVKKGLTLCCSFIRGFNWETFLSFGKYWYDHIQ